MKRTAVLFVCHIVNDESKFRFEQLKRGCDEMGYDLYWGMDEDSVDVRSLPLDVPAYEISFGRFTKLFPHMVYSLGDDRTKYFNFLYSAYHMFVNDNPGRYDRIWMFEYDVCCYGEWKDFFQKHENDEAELICNPQRYKIKEEDLHKEWLWQFMNDDIMNYPWMGYLTHALLCGCRMDVSLHQKVCDFFQQFPEGGRSRLHMEFAWPTVTKLTGGRISTFASTQFDFSPQLTEDFENYQRDNLYHPVKLGVSWRKVLTDEDVQKRTAVLFLCHVVNEETIFRYNHLKRGCDEMGYELWWVFDCENDFNGKLPPQVNFYTYSYSRLCE